MKGENMEGIMKSQTESLNVSGTPVSDGYYDVLASRLKISNWLSRGGVQYEEEGANRWIVYLSHSYADYSVAITRHNGWLSLYAILMPVPDKNELEETLGIDIQKWYLFLEFLMSLNTEINGVHISVDEQNSKVVLIRDEDIRDVSEVKLARSVSTFHRSHEMICQILLSKAGELGVADAAMFSPGFQH